MRGEKVKNPELWKALYSLRGQKSWDRGENLLREYIGRQGKERGGCKRELRNNCKLREQEELNQKVGYRTA